MAASRMTFFLKHWHFLYNLFLGVHFLYFSEYPSDRSDLRTQRDLSLV